ncbi:DNA polymerase III subunit gamma/tau [Novibacillus thermophilus]|uniref:DNA-directed DNA polymerase n=1 Tax=Novibacillus thermophilus TaxID=1471761 RepID=A0A1U9K332_9BACL|nr:DNA polymerase III subunit gamma/tau [Novibacillus thermophilus]AQS54437.1 hypothetical protein B0W44_00110 [Novibacillus thermophilus]
MTYRALYRVWRPQTFSDIVGQQHVTRTLQNALRQQRFSHAYLFSGPRGTGKTSAAKVMAKAVNCEQGPAPEPCNACEACQQITNGSILDVVEIDAASNRGIEEIRDLRDKVKYAPTEVRTKVYIIDEVHMLTPEAFNALLKTLEEPPSHVLFILATTEPHKLPLTIVSRCQRFDFHRVSPEIMVERLKHVCEQEGIQADESALSFIARVSEGGLRDALSLLDQAYASGGDCITENVVRTIVGTVADSSFHQIVTFIAERKTAQMLDMVSELVQEGHDPEKFAEDFLGYLRDMLLVKTAPNLPETEQLLKIQPSLAELAEQFTEEAVFAMMEEANDALSQMRRTNQPRIMLELLLVKLTHVSNERQQVKSSELASLIKRVEQLEQDVRKRSVQAAHRQGEVAKEDGADAVKIDGSKRKSSEMSPSQLQKVRAVLERADAASLANIKDVWPDILASVKERKITVHAWLIDGVPTAADEGHLVLAFKNVIHRETTEKPDHKQLIEEVIEQVTGRAYKLVTCMQNEWKRLEESSAGREQAAAGHVDQDEHVRQALEWFGEDLVEIRD